MQTNLTDKFDNIRDMVLQKQFAANKKSTHESDLAQIPINFRMMRLGLLRRSFDTLTRLNSMLGSIEIDPYDPNLFIFDKKFTNSGAPDWEHHWYKREQAMITAIMLDQQASTITLTNFLLENTANYDRVSARPCCVELLKLSVNGVVELELYHMEGAPHVVFNKHGYQLQGGFKFDEIEFECDYIDQVDQVVALQKGLVAMHAALFNE